MDEQGFVHLRVRSAYSLLEGAIKADKIAALAAKAGMPAVGMTDRANLFGALEFSSASKDAGVQPIVGCALPVSGVGERLAQRWAREPTVVLLAQNETGWLNLTALSSKAFLDSEGEPSVPWREVADRAEGLILLSGGPDGPVDPPVRRRARRRRALAALAAMQRGVRRPLLCGAAAPRPAGGAGGRARVWSPSPTTTTSRWWPPTTPISPRRDMRQGARRPAVHRRRRRSSARTTAGASRAEHWFKPAEAMRRAVRRPAGGLRQHARHRPPLRLHGQQARRRSCRVSTPARAATRRRSWRSRRARA